MPSTEIARQPVAPAQGPPTQPRASRRSSPYPGAAGRVAAAASTARIAPVDPRDSCIRRDHDRHVFGLVFDLARACASPRSSSANEPVRRVAELQPCAPPADWHQGHSVVGRHHRLQLGERCRGAKIASGSRPATGFARGNRRRARHRRRVLRPASPPYCAPSRRSQSRRAAACRG